MDTIAKGGSRVDWSILIRFERKHRVTITTSVGRPTDLITILVKRFKLEPKGALEWLQPPVTNYLFL